ncbi:MAG: flavodoxin family protein [Spirochaetes bacterium]|nr:MAG: flavodoxin family protein [Spirochaetota bacterium]
MQVLVLYYSRTGKTEQLAQAVAEGVRQIDGVEAVLKKAEEADRDDFLSCNGIVAGSPVYFGTMAAELKSVFDRLVAVRKKMEGKVGAAFATSNEPTGGKETTIMSILQALLIYGMIVVGDPMEATGHYGTACSGRPDQDTLKNAAALGRRVASLVKRLHQKADE